MTTLIYCTAVVNWQIHCPLSQTWETRNCSRSYSLYQCTQKWEFN